ncbi:IS5 family transposase [Microcoleus sp. D3_18_C4]|uniref:IS5 family transposase n=1 Tax=Microcoleus sp. D3_18_C4 TaxID=3055335 RepID=UPI002FD27754
MPYSTNLTDAQWETLSPLLNQILPLKKKTRPPNWTQREIFNGIFYQLKNGCNWADLPKDLPPYSTVYWYYKQWREQGVLEELMKLLHSQVRSQVKKKPKWTRLMIIDSQAVKNTCNASIASKGYCFYKSTNGIKRHLAVDTLGFPFFTHCTKASLSDDAGLIEMLSKNINYFKSKPVNVPKVTILLDHGYHPDHLTAELKKIYPQILTKIKFELSEKPSKKQKEAQGQSGFVPVKARWVIERSNSWMERCKILIKNFERTLDNATAKMNLCFIRLMIKRLAS